VIFPALDTKMGRFLGLRGSSLNVATILLVVFPAYMCFGYNLAVAGGLLTLPSFIAQYPQMDTINTTGAQNKLNTNIQGKSRLSAYRIDAGVLILASDQAR
jgi:hypothetical protein